LKINEKTIEFFLSYFLRSATLVYNEANKYEVEEPYLEAREPAGLQVIESLIYNENSAESKIKLLQHLIKFL
jgi:cytochrome c peroxidase